MSELGDLYRAHVAHLTEGYHRALDTTGFDAVVVHAGRLELKSAFDDQEWPFRAVPAFEHWVDIDWPDSAILVRQGRTPVLLARRNSSFWEKPKPPNFELIQAGLEVVEVSEFSDVRGHLDDVGKCAFIGHDAEGARELELADEGYNPAPLIRALHALRTAKTPYEVQCLFEASVRAARGHRAVADAFAAGVRSELDLHLTYLMSTEQDDAECPYKNIVALGEAGAVLHHISYREAPEAQSLLIDAGARVRRYCSDITRTYAVRDAGEPAARFAALVDGMEALQLAVIDGIEAGAPYEALHDEAHAKLGDLLVDSGLAKISAEACVESGLTRVLFPHGLGHSLGVQVHDVGMRESEPRADNPFLRNTSVISEGQVFTVEPGLYFIEHLLAEAKAGAHADSLDWDLVGTLRPFGGIRIEDNVLVRAEGARNLTREAFARLEED